MEKTSLEGEADTARSDAFVRVPWYPLVFASTYVLNLWVESGVSVMAVARSATAALVVASLLVLVALAVTRRPHAAGVLALLALLLLISRGPLYIGALVVLAVAVPLALALWGRIRRRPVTWAQVTRGLNLFSIFLVAIVLVGGVIRGTFAAVIEDLQQGRPTLDAAAADGGSQPDVYVLMLDGYPRSDSLARLFGVDNSAFEEELEERGFSIAARSESNYMFTQLTLTSMFHIQPVPDIETLQPVIAGDAAPNPLMRNVLNDNPVFDIFRDHGYRVVTSSPGFEHVALRRSDVYLDDGQLNEFEYHLLRFTTIQSVVNLLSPEFFADQHRSRIRSGFEHFTAVTEDVGPRTFAFIHLPTPHLPVVFDEDGSSSGLQPSEDIFSWDEIDPVTREAYGRQLIYLNARVLELVDGARAAHPEERQPVIIIMSDHGAAPRPAVFVGEGTDEHYASFFAASTPGAAALFEPDISPINVFPRLFNEYFDADIDDWPNGPYPWLELK